MMMHATSLDLFAGIPVADYKAALEWYQQLLGPPPAFFSNDIEAAFTHLPVLTTDRLRLREVQPGDAGALFAIKSDPEVTRRYGHEPHRSLDDTRAWMERIRDSYTRRDGLFWCLTLNDQDTPIGSSTLWHLDLDSRCAELGYELHPAYSWAATHDRLSHAPGYRDNCLPTEWWYNSACATGSEPRGDMYRRAL